MAVNNNNFGILVKTVIGIENACDIIFIHNKEEWRIRDSKPIHSHLIVENKIIKKVVDSADFYIQSSSQYDTTANQRMFMRCSLKAVKAPGCRSAGSSRDCSVTVNAVQMDFQSNPGYLKLFSTGKYISPPTRFPHFRLPG